MKTDIQNLGRIDYRKIDKALARFFEAHSHITDESLLCSGETLMDGPEFYKLRQAFKPETER